MSIDRYRTATDHSAAQSCSPMEPPMEPPMDSLVLQPSWFARPAIAVAPDLIGCTLVRQLPDRQLRGLIVETEAYEPGDPACHGYRRKTARNAAMFGPPGTVYVYLIYGMYHCLNFSTDAAEVASAVLVRALALEASTQDWVIQCATQARAAPPAHRLAKSRTSAQQRVKPERLAAGPGKLCQCFAIDQAFNGYQINSHQMNRDQMNNCQMNRDQMNDHHNHSPLSSTDQGIWVEGRSPQLIQPSPAQPPRLVQTTRIGITQGTDLPWRWYLQDCPAVSKP